MVTRDTRKSEFGFRKGDNQHILFFVSSTNPSILFFQVPSTNKMKEKLGKFYDVFIFFCALITILFFAIAIHPQVRLIARTS